MRFKILDEADDTPKVYDRRSLVDRIRDEIRDRKELEEFLKDFDKKKDEKKGIFKIGLTRRDVFYLMTLLSLPVAYVTTTMMKFFWFGLQNNIHEMFPKQ